MDDRGGGGGSFVAVRRVAPRLEQGSVYHSSSSRKNFIITLLSLSSSCGTNAFSSLSLSHTFLTFFLSLAHTLFLSLSLGSRLITFLRFGAADLCFAICDVLLLLINRCSDYVCGSSL